MRTIILIITSFWLFPVSVFGIGAEISTVEELTNALMPTRTEMPKIRTRGFGGIKEQPQAPSVAMNLKFELNKSELTDDDIRFLDNLGEALEKEILRGYVYQLEGHTCDLGTDNYNYELSRQRALAVKSYLLKNFNLDDQQLKVAWFGETRPAMPNSNEEARKQNRRVVVINTLEPFGLPLNPDQTVAMQTKYLVGNKEVTLVNGDTLTTNQQYAVQFKTNEDLYVYIYQIDEIGELTILFPTTDFSSLKNPVISGTFQRVPGEGKWFYLDDTVGTEKVILIASRKSIEDHATLCQQIADGTEANEIVAQASVTRGLGGVVSEQAKEDTGPNDSLPEVAKSKTSAKSTSEIFVIQNLFLHR